MAAEQVGPSPPWWEDLDNLFDRAERERFSFFTGDEQANDKLVDLLGRQPDRAVA